MSNSRSRALTLAVSLALIVMTAGCGSSHPASSGQTPTAAVTPTSPSPTTSSPGSPSPSAHPSTATAPEGFKASSVTFVSSREAFVLGTAPGHGTLLLRTLDRGTTWARLAAPSAPLGRPGTGSASAVWGTRFASAAHGFVFGRGLWETTTGGTHWVPASAPAGQILSLATIDGQLLALVSKGSGPASLLRRPLTGGSWSVVAAVKTAGLLDSTDLISTQAGTAAVLDGASVIVTTNGGLTVTLRATPAMPGFVPGSVAVTSAHTLALLLVGQGYTGHTVKRVATSSDLGAHWTVAGRPSDEGDGGVLAGGSADDLVLATASAASWLDRSPDGGHSWSTIVTYGDGGIGWADLGFTTVSNAVVVHGPAAAGCPSPVARTGRGLGLPNGMAVPALTNLGCLSRRTGAGTASNRNAPTAAPLPSLYRTALRLRRDHPALGRRGTLRWLHAGEPLCFALEGSVFAANLGAVPAPLPAHREILLTSGLVTGGSLPPDTAAWLSS